MADLSFRATIKPVEVEELVDLFVHRPIAHLIARASYATPITPDQLTVLSMIVGLASAACIVASVTRGPSMLATGGLLLIASAVVDCSDGQLARMRQSQSRYGRMLDGAVDAIVQISVIPAVMFYLAARHRDVPAAAAFWVLLTLVAAVTGTMHTSLYDQFKNVYLSQTQSSRREDSEDPEDLAAIWTAMKARGAGLSERLRFELYRSYVERQRAQLRAVDPNVPGRYRDLPDYSEAGAARYRALNRRVMRAWSFFGVGTHIFGLGLALLVDRVEVYVVARAVLYNVALAALTPLQRRASRAYFSAPEAP